MLRRKPTAISLTSEDITAYEEGRAQLAAERRAAEAEEQARIELEKQRAMRSNHGSSRGNSRDVTTVPNNPGGEHVAPARRTREERLGIGRAL